MPAHWGLTIDCRGDARALMTFWKEALGYVDAPPPQGYESWEDWMRHYQVPDDEWNNGGSLVDPAGVLPKVGFLQVPESKVVKNRIHLDLLVSGGRHIDQEVRRERILTRVGQLVAAGATVLSEESFEDVLDHVVLADPEGNELCVV